MFLICFAAAADMPTNFRVEHVTSRTLCTSCRQTARANAEFAYLPLNGHNVVTVLQRRKRVLDRQITENAIFVVGNSSSCRISGIDRCDFWWMMYVFAVV